MTREAESVLTAADLVWCAPRHIGLVPGDKARPITSFSGAMEEMVKALARNCRVAVLVSGDAGLYSMLGMLTERFGRERLRVYPGVSALQAFCAAMGISWQEATILSAHGRRLSGSALCHAVRTSRKTLLFLDGEHDPAWVRDVLDRGGLGHAGLTVGERLSYEDQSVAPYEQRPYAPLCMACVQNEHPQCGLPPIGLPDDAFVRGKTPMTKQEIRAMAVTALALRPNDVVWDVGAGTGSVTVECARQCPLGEVYAVEYKDEALELIRQNLSRFHLLNVTVVPGKAPDVLASLPVPDAVFLGGTEGSAAAVLALLRALGKPVRIAATAVTMESAGELAALMKDLPCFAMRQIAISRLEPAGRYTMFRAQNPVFLMTAATEKSAQWPQ